jgi:PilZ domain
MPNVDQHERRRTRRVRMKQPLRVRPADPKDGRLGEELGTSKDVSQDGVYFVTQRQAYYQGMRLFVMVPYDSSARQQNYEYFGEVIRIDDLGNDQRGVAIKFLPAPAKASSNQIVYNR